MSPDPVSSALKPHIPESPPVATIAVPVAPSPPAVVTGVGASMPWHQAIQAALNIGDISKARSIHADAQLNLTNSSSAQIPVKRLISDWALVLAPQWQQTHTGLRVRLRQPDESDAPFLVRCFWDEEFMAQFHPTASHQRSEVAIRKALAHSSMSLPRFKAQHWLIERMALVGRDSCAAAKPIGLISVVDLVVAHRRAELLVGMPESSHRGVGLAAEATLLALDVCFNQIGLNKLTSLVLAGNQHSQRSTLAMGFGQEGLRKAHFRWPNSEDYVDCFENGLTVSAFRANQRLSKLSQRLLGRNIVSFESVDSSPI